MIPSSLLRCCGRRCRSGAAAVALLLAIAPAGAAPPLVESVLKGAPPAAESRCSYTRIKQEDEESKRERYRAGVIPPWELVQVNGRAPNRAELRDYAVGSADRDRRHPLAFDLRGMVEPDQWRLLSETEDRARYEFRLRPTEELNEALAAKVRGILEVDKARNQPDSIVIENTEAAYVAPFVRIAEYRQVMDFEWDPDIGAAVLTEAETRMRGRALGLRLLRQHKLVRYTDYTCEAVSS